MQGPVLDRQHVTLTNFCVQFWLLFHEQEHQVLYQIPFDRQLTAAHYFVRVVGRIFTTGTVQSNIDFTI